jgi:hypothetical protein
MDPVSDFVGTTLAALRVLASLFFFFLKDSAW